MVSLAHKKRMLAHLEKQERELEQQQARLASILQFDPEAKVCAACGVLIYPADTLPCRDVPDCEARMGK